jgi:hypothetical protein
MTRRGSTSCGGVRARRVRRDGSDLPERRELGPSADELRRLGERAEELLELQRSRDRRESGWSGTGAGE